MEDISVPILLALSDISVIAISAYFAAFSVSPPRDWIRLAEKPVTVSMYSLAEMPAVLYALGSIPLDLLRGVLEQSVNTADQLFIVSIGRQ